VKQKLAASADAVRLSVVRQVTQTNPAHSVGGPKYVVMKGKTPVWSREDGKKVIGFNPNGSAISGLQDLGVHCRDALQLRPSSARY
jgi:hypothetical protein